MAEAAWVALVFEAMANGTASAARRAVDLPYLAFALPAVVAVFAAVVVAGHRRGGRRRLRQLTLALVVVVGAGLTAGVIAGLGAHGALGSLVAHPWALGRAGRAAKWAWAVAILAWGRGTWLGLSAPSSSQVSASLGVGAVVFLCVFVAQHVVHRAAYAHATGSAAWLLFLFFPVGITAAAWLHERGVERSVLRRLVARPGGAWIVLLTVPLALVALLALLIGGGGGPVGTGIVDAARAIGGAIAAAGDWLAHLLPNFHLHAGAPRPQAHGRSAPGKLPPAPHEHALTWLSVTISVLVAVAVVVVVVLVARVALSAIRRRTAAQPDAGGDEERESIFSWDHVLTQLRAAWRHLLAHLRPRPRPSSASGALAAMETADVDDGSARAAYRRLLRAARAAGHGRAPSETTAELEARLGAALAGTLDGEPLATLTAIYDRARYGEVDTGAAERGVATVAADALARALSGTAAPGPTGVATGHAEGSGRR
ncbi:MAG: DUF4129 domain-containing protein [Acidimicrobiales bacterium]